MTNDGVSEPNNKQKLTIILLYKLANSFCCILGIECVLHYRVGSLCNGFVKF